MKILVTGGAGHLGSRYAMRLQEGVDKVDGIDSVNRHRGYCGR